MPKLVKDGVVVDDLWQLLAKDASLAIDAISENDFLVLPLALWQQHADTLAGKSNIGVWLDSDEAPQPLADVCQALPLIAINFPVFSDGRGYSYARQLREYYGFKGELRAIGDILKDQIYFYKRCGFNSYSIRDDRDAELAAKSLSDFSTCYQAANDSVTPLLRRH